MIGLVRRRPERFVAQEMVPLSTHPTVVGAGIAPRRVDLRPYVVSPAGAGPSVMPGGLTRYAKAADEMVVNSSQGGGSKDTWVLAPPTATVMKTRSLASLEHRPLIGVTTSEVRPKERTQPTPREIRRAKRWRSGSPT